MRKLMLVLAAVACLGLVAESYAAEPYKFLGQDEIANVYDNLKNITDEIKRGEFEKKQEYENRVKSIQKEKVKPFIIEVANDRFEYNSDNEEFTFEKYFGSISDDFRFNFNYGIK